MDARLLSPDGHSAEQGAGLSDPERGDGEHCLGHKLSARTPTTLAWKDVHFRVGNKHIVRGISGRAEPNRLLAILGASGAGKTSFLNVVAGRVVSGHRGKLVEGRISFNGKAVDPAEFRSHVAYVMQQDALFATQTPREALHFSAALRLPQGTSPAVRSQLVESLLASLSLSKCQDTYIGSVMVPGLSGGEKKRTAIGVELISQPDVLFLDEPTSGLDSYAAMAVVKILRALAREGCTVVTTIHQPSSEVFGLFDDVLFLAEGRALYQGPSAGLLPWFEERGFPCPPLYNPADFVMYTAQTQPSAALQAMADAWTARPGHVDESQFRSSTELGLVVEPVAAAAAAAAATGGAATAIRKPGLLAQTWHLSVREFRNVARDRVALTARFGVTAMLNLIVGCVFLGAGKDWGAGSPNDPVATAVAIQNHFGALSNVAISAMFGLAQPLLLSFPLEKPVFLREYATNTYGALPYFISKAVIEIPMAVAQAACIYLVSFWLIGLEGNFVYLTLATAMLGLVSASTALVISAVASNVNVAIQLSPVLFIPQILFSGLFIRTASIPAFLRWAQYLCSLKYAINLVSIVEFRNPPDMYRPYVYAPGAFFDSMDISVDREWLYFGIMVSALFAFRVAACMILSYKARHLS